MNGFADLVKTADGGPSPEVRKLQAYMKGAVVEGKAANFDWGNVNAILNNDRARGILMEFVKGEYSDENLLFWQEVRGGVPANPQSVYDTYIAATAAKQVNLPAPKRKPFDDINAATPKNWAARAMDGCESRNRRDDQARHIAAIQSLAESDGRRAGRRRVRAWATRPRTPTRSVSEGGPHDRAAVPLPRRPSARGPLDSPIACGFARFRR